MYIVHAAGGCIESCAGDFLEEEQLLSEAVDAHAVFLLRFRATRDPFCRPVLAREKSELEAAFRGGSFFIVFVPKSHLPADLVAAFERCAAVGNVGHFRAADFSGVPYRFAVSICDDPIGALCRGALAVPEKAGLCTAEPQRLLQIFRSQTYGFHVVISSEFSCCKYSKVSKTAKAKKREFMSEFRRGGVAVFSLLPFRRGHAGIFAEVQREIAGRGKSKTLAHIADAQTERPALRNISRS